MNHINKQKQGQTNSKEFRHISNSDSNGLDAIRGHAAKHAAAGTPSDQITGLIRAVYIEQRKLDEWESDELKIKVVVEEEIQNHKRQRRQEQRDAARAIGEGKDADTLLVAEKLTLEEAGDRFVFITNGRQVYDLDNPVAPPLSFPDFEATYAYSKHTYNDPKGMPRTKTVAKEWLESPNRKTAPEVTYKPGAGLMTRNPLGTIAVNLWQKKSRKRAPADWQKRIMPFIEHTKYLWADDADT